ncbi:uncharacterized protein LOC112213428 [Bombus impatiens]|uniref:Uncharacterized protein LOC112213428 n=1 Tax=Bombus impatiens TaxID=132113 RepID=A0A6P6FGM3_BOMIM|nr:uncharacterized protein LOC112213428 [Bombus impatiens]
MFSIAIVVSLYRFRAACCNSFGFDGGATSIQRDIRKIYALLKVRRVLTGVSKMYDNLWEKKHSVTRNSRRLPGTNQNGMETFDERACGRWRMILCVWDLRRKW